MIVLTDLSEVLIRGVHGTETFVKERYGKKVAKRYLKRCREINSIFCELLRGHISEDIYWEVFLQEGKWPFNVKELKEILSFNIAEEIPGTLSVYQRIIGYPDVIADRSIQCIGRPEIWLVSDHIQERKTELEYLHPEIFTLTTQQIWSFDRSKIKSDPGFFDEIMSRYDLSTRDVVFIDDMVENTYPAINSGIIGIQFKNAELLESSLSMLGFLFADTVDEANRKNSLV